MFIRALLLFCLVGGLITGCYRAPRHIDPTVDGPRHAKEIHREKRTFLHLPQDFSISPFSPLTAEELAQDWGKEYRIALAFAEDFDLYRAITGFKRALCLLSSEEQHRYLEIEYAIALAYYLGKKYVETIYVVESSSLAHIDGTFPAFPDLLLILYDSYEQVGKEELAASILKLIEEDDPHQAKQLTLLSAIKQADLGTLYQEGETHEKHAYFKPIVTSYRREAKSVRRAEFLNAILPGAGYWYVGLRGTAVTALLVNTLFTAAGTHFAMDGNTPVAAILLSLESGWYLGGIYGGGLAAKSYNEQLYGTYAQKITERERFFPLLMLKYSF